MMFFLLTSNANKIEINNMNLNVEDSLKDLLKKNLNLYALAKQLQKVSLLIIETIKSDKININYLIFISN